MNAAELLEPAIEENSSGLKKGELCEVTEHSVLVVEEGKSKKEDEVTVVSAGPTGLVFAGNPMGQIKCWRYTQNADLIVQPADCDQGGAGVRAIALSQSERVLARGDEDGLVTVYQLKDRKILRDPTSCHKTSHAIRSIDIHEDSSTVVFASFSEAFIWNFLSGSCMILPKPTPRDGEEFLTFWTVKLTAEKVFAHLGGRSTLTFWPIPLSGFTSPQLLGRARKGPISCFSVSYDGATLSAGSSHGTLEVVDTKSGVLLADEQILPVERSIQQIEVFGEIIYLYSSIAGVNHEVAKVQLKITESECELVVQWRQILPNAFSDLHHMKTILDENLLLIMCGNDGPLLTQALSSAHGTPLERLAVQELDLDISCGEVEDGEETSRDEDGGYSHTEEMANEENDRSSKGEGKKVGPANKDDVPKEGMQFPTRKEARMFVQRYSEQAYVALTTKSSQGKQGGLHIECKHGARRAYQGKGIKRWSTSEKKDCPFKIRLSTRSNDVTTVTMVNLKHNHPVSYEIYVQVVCHFHFK